MKKAEKITLLTALGAAAAIWAVNRSFGINGVGAAQEFPEYGYPLIIGVKTSKFSTYQKRFTFGDIKTFDALVDRMRLNKLCNEYDCGLTNISADLKYAIRKDGGAANYVLYNVSKLVNLLYTAGINAVESALTDGAYIEVDNCDGYYPGYSGTEIKITKNGIMGDLYIFVSNGLI